MAKRLKSIKFMRVKQNGIAAAKKANAGLGTIMGIQQSMGSSSSSSSGGGSAYSGSSSGGGGSSGSSSGGGSSTAAIHQPTAEELRLEQRRKDVQKWLTEGTDWKIDDSSLWSMSQEKYNEKRVVGLEYYLLQYKNDPYVAENIKNEIANIKGENQAIVPQTTKFEYSHYWYFTEELIQAFHIQDSVIFGVGGLMGEEASHFAAFGQTYNEIEQNETFPLESILKNVGLDIISKDYPEMTKALAVLDAGISISSENRKSYLLDGFRVYEDDIYLNIVLRTNLGDEIRSAEFVFRNDALVHIVDTGTINAIGPGEARFRSWQNGINREWEREGYVGR